MLGRKRAMCDPNMGTPSNVGSCTTSTTGAWVYAYSPAGDMLTQKDAKNQTLTFTYDELGRPKTKKQGTTTIASWNYDNPAVMFSKGRVTQVVDYPATQNTTTNFTYDVLGRVTQSQRILMGTTYNMAQAYDALGRIKTETFPAPDNETVTYNYNEAGWLKSVTNYITDVQYDARGQRTQLTYANNLVSSWSYDANRFWENSRITSGGQQNLTYTRDAKGNILTIVDGLFTGSRTFTYDDLNRIDYALTSQPGSSPTPCNFTYNAIGNLLSRCAVTLSYTDPMHPSAVTNHSTNGKNYTYDANGNMTARGTQTLTWDIENRVTSISILGGGSAVMEYDSTGMRIKKNATTTGLTLYPFTGYEIDASGTITKFIRIGNETVASRKRTSAGVTTKYFYHNDHLGGVNVITDSGGVRVQLHEYGVWGGVARADGNVDPDDRFTGQKLDPETGVYYYGGRYYDYELGRFVSPDPYIQEPDNPQNLNRYTYVLNNPQNYVDPSGHWFWIVNANSSIFTSIFTATAPVLAEGMSAVAIATAETAAALQTAMVGLSGVGGAARQLQNQAELRNAVDKSAAKQSMRQATPQGNQALSRNIPSGDFPEEQQPWWSRMLDSLIPNAYGACRIIYCQTQLDGGGGAGKIPFGGRAPGGGGVSGGGSVGAMRRNEYVGVPKHGSAPHGRAGPAPTNGQGVLDISVQVKPTSPTRVGVDYQTGDFVVFHENIPGQFSGHVRPWAGEGGLTQEMRNSLIKSGLTTPRGRIIY